ncbi:unnamed protein product [Rhodiola kirilowii]
MNQAFLIAGPLLASIAEILTLVEKIQQQKQEFFVEIGCYLYRTSLVIMELRTLEGNPASTIEVLQSLSEGITLAKDIINRCQMHEHSISRSEMENSAGMLKIVINQMGKKLSLIPSSTYGDEKYAEIGIQVISKEMKCAQFGLIEANQLKSKELKENTSLKEKHLEQEINVNGTDLYSVDMEDFTEIYSPSSSSSSMRNTDDLSIGSSASSLQFGQYIEPLYDAFFCPLTKNIMEEPVTVESGVTYERQAILKWFKEFEGLEAICCPTTGKMLKSRSLSINVALKTTIDEWKKRNDAARIRLSRAALSLASSESMVLEALHDLQTICHNKAPNKQQIRENGIIPLLIKFLQYKNSKVRCATLQMLQELAEDGEESKILIGTPGNILKIMKLISSNHKCIRHGALLLLFELSIPRSLCDSIGSVTGGILTLISVKYNQVNDTFASQKAYQILRNLERSSQNVKLMAENGYLDPLLNHLIEGNAKTKMEMTIYLGEIILSDENKCYVAQRASPALTKMACQGDSLNRKVAFNALQQISTYHAGSRILVETGVIQMLVEEILNRKIHIDEPVDLRREATGIIANILESGAEFENSPVNNQGHAMASDYIVFNIICLIRNSTPDEVNLNLIRILLCLADSPKIMATIVQVIKETETSYTLIGFINYPHEQIGIAAIKLLIKLSPHIGHTLVDKLCKTKGQPENLIWISEDQTMITEKHAVAANFLAKLPHQNLTLNLALLNFDAAGTVLQLIVQVQRNGIQRSRHAKPYLEGLVGILVRCTATLYDPQMLYLARNHNLTSVFTELLLEKSSDEVQRLSLIGLSNLSSQSSILSKPPQIRSPRYMKSSNLLNFLKCRSASKKNIISCCPIHKGICSAQETFCLVEAKAVEKLLACLDHETAEVVEAALSAIRTLLDDNVDSDKSITMLTSYDATQRLLKVVKEHKQESLWENAFWVLEKFLSNGKDKSVSDISHDRWLHATLVNVYHTGNANARQIAERLLRHTNKIPDLVSGTYTF